MKNSYLATLFIIILLNFSSCNNDDDTKPISLADDPAAKSIRDIFTKEDFELWFPDSIMAWGSKTRTRNPFYSYEAFIEAAKRYPKFGTEGSVEQNKKEIAAFLANCAHETTGGWSTAPGPHGTYSWGLYWIREVGCTPQKPCQQYTVPNQEYPPMSTEGYYGRGPLQISYNYNYGRCSEDLFGDKTILLKNPDMVATDSVLAFKAALWFWMTPQPPKPSCHQIMLEDWVPSRQDSMANRLPKYQFAMTIVVINGGVECYGTGTPSLQALNRVGFDSLFLDFYNIKKDLPVSDCDCSKISPY
ncbi:chitinase [Aureibacter tunicatorum]|uniref:Glycoside hydrolase family 19 catalytic domain-containing protein n=1 Tax=Aureibacter tunicatorum TaxID=866807 RepID=A0AAE3XME0_9BACT|nr:chitinase [Aureibacter tunicatorum]MDR6239612.1 hypothetical protein [Aureibacter tunicatorum]BDD04089.1 hypothetical protein AUTU_15720 [Aureibacter tunicatorum]